MFKHKKNHNNNIIDHIWDKQKVLQFRAAIFFNQKPKNKKEIEKNEILKIIINIYFSLLRSNKKRKTVFDVWMLSSMAGRVEK